MRDGAFSEVLRATVVLGNVVSLCAGDMVPADARLLSAKDLHVQQSALTGESMPVEKEYAAGDETEATKVLLGTSVVSGTATALVLATGQKTAFGDIATRLRARPPETEFDRGVRQFGHLIMKLVFGLVLFILVVRIGTHRGAFESLLFAVALAVALVRVLGAGAGPRQSLCVCTSNRQHTESGAAEDILVDVVRQPRALSAHCSTCLPQLRSADSAQSGEQGRVESASACSPTLRDATRRRAADPRLGNPNVLA